MIRHHHRRRDDRGADRVLFFKAASAFCSAWRFGALRRLSRPPYLRNFASYAAALAGYTAINHRQYANSAPQAAPADRSLHLRVTRAVKSCIGIVSAGVVLAGTDLGGARPPTRSSSLLRFQPTSVGGLVKTFSAEPTRVVANSPGPPRSHPPGH